MAVSWIVLLELGDGVNREEAHVVGVHETRVVQVVLLLEDHFVAELLRKPSHVFGNGQPIDIAGEENGRNVVVFQGDQRSLFSSIDF